MADRMHADDLVIDRELHRPGHDGDVEALSVELAEKIRAGSIAIDDRALRAHVRQSLADALSINNPKWMTR